MHAHAQKIDKIKLCIFTKKHAIFFIFFYKKHLQKILFFVIINTMQTRLIDFMQDLRTIARTRTQSHLILYMHNQSCFLHASTQNQTHDCTIARTRTQSINRVLFCDKITKTKKEKIKAKNYGKNIFYKIAKHK